jgi:DMSO/TMAO reductase YedYZ molybdopterin-dependent catalytic subunit
MQRRTFIIAAVAGGVGLLEYTYFSGWMNQLRDTRPRLRVRDYLHLGEQAALAAITPAEDFYNVQKGAPVRVDAARWRLRVDGLVERPLSLTLEEVRSRPAVERALTLECVDNRIGGYYIGNARWKGVELDALLREAGVRAEARYAVLYGADGLTSGHPLDRLQAGDVHLAYEMNGQPLPVNHGFPLRILIPGKYGYKQPKWLTRIELVDRQYLGYWERKGWNESGERGIHARFDAPEDLKQLRGSSFMITGYALGGRRGVRAVEISTGGDWERADVFSNPSTAAWAFWKYPWKPAPGRYELRVRGIGGDGSVQAEGPHDPFPNGATGQQLVNVEVFAVS